MINHIKANGSSNRSRQKQTGWHFKLAFITSVIILIIYFMYKSMPVTAEQLNYQPVIVRHGDTLWGLAKDTGIHMDTHRLVLKIMVYNSLANSTILPGQTIYIPTAM